MFTTLNLISQSIGNVSYGFLGPLSEEMVWSRLFVSFSDNGEIFDPEEILQLWLGFFDSTFAYSTSSAFFASFRDRLVRPVARRQSGNSIVADGMVQMGPLARLDGRQAEWALNPAERLPWLGIVMNATIGEAAALLYGNFSALVDRKQNDDL